MKKKRVVVSVISDLVTDQRVHRVCSFLHENGFEVSLIGRKLKKSLPVENRDYTVKRIRSHFDKGVLKYAEFDLKLFFKILFKKADLFLSNDLDTLVPNFIISRLRGKKLVYDTHEYFTGMPELQKKPFKKRIWKTVEKFILPKLKHAYTVSQSVADQYEKDYGIHLKVVRNTPVLTEQAPETSEKIFPEEKKVLLLQGSGINMDRGAEELIGSMKLLPEKFLLVLIGGGEAWKDLKKLPPEYGIENKVRFIEKLPPEELKKYTRGAYLGFSLDKPTNPNYCLSLPNKLFDYIHASLPVIASEIKEVKKIVDHYKVGAIISEVTPEAIAKTILMIDDDPDQYKIWKENTSKAAWDLCWQNEQIALKEIFEVVQSNISSGNPVLKNLL